MGKKIKLRFIEDPGHGWAEVPKEFAQSIGLSDDYCWQEDMLYLEEDCEVRELEDALREHGYECEFEDCYVDDFDVWLNSKAWPNIPAIGGE